MEIILNKESIIEGNSKICIFLGGTVKQIWKIQGISTYAWYGKVAHKWRKNKLKLSIGESIILDQLLFHSSYEWIMDVVEKIESLGYVSTIEQLQHGEHRVFFNKKETLEGVANGARDTESKKIAIYKAVVDFIDWYNKNT